MPTPIDTLKKLSQFEQQSLFVAYVDTAKDLLDDAVGSAEIESFDEAAACLEDFEACMGQAAVLKDILVNAIKAKK
jgi:hypothetical protein